jgi:phosphoribosyl-AMP cyclohydrolase
MLKIDFDKQNGLVPAIIQDAENDQVCMLGYMNEVAFKRTLESGWVYFWSRSRKKLWMKGEQSGNRLKVKKVYVDCDNDSLLVRASLLGKSTCHTGNKSCFFRKLK